MRLGKEAFEALRAEITGQLYPGDELVVVGAVALDGTARLARKNREQLKKIFSPAFLSDAESLPCNYGVGTPASQSQAWKIAADFGANAIYPLGEGGFLCGLWKMAEASQVGLKADLRKVPIRQETIEICEIYDLNPYKFFSAGSILVGISAGEALAEEYQRMGFVASVIGHAGKGADRLLYSGSIVRYLDRPKESDKEVTCFGKLEYCTS